MALTRVHRVAFFGKQLKKQFMEGYISDSLSVTNKKRNNSLINKKIICRVLGVLLLVEVCMLLTCVGVAWGYGESDGLDFLLAAGITALAAGLLLLAGRRAERRMSKRDGYCVAALTWVLFSLFGMLPFLLTHSVASTGAAFFETMSGFTTTGATIMDNIDTQSHAILFWRALTHWIGGLGIVFFAIAILPAFSDGSNLQLFSAEAVGVTHDKIHPKVSTMARWLWTIYLILTVSEIILLRLGGMGWFDSVCHTFATVATGGFSTKQASVAYWNSPYIEYVIAIFMVLAGINFSLYFSCLKGKFGKIWRDEETRWYLGSIFIATFIIAVALVLKNGYGVEEAFRKSFFQVVTLHTSCGFATDDYMLWPPFTWLLLCYTMLAGGCTGSTSGGIKNLRLLIMTKGIRNHFRKLLHPNAVMQIRVNRQAVPSNVVLTVAIFICLYLVCVFVGWILFMLMGINLMDAFGVSVSSMGNAGLALGMFGPAYSWSALPEAGKWLSSFLMLLGRLEMFAVMLLFYSAFWKNR